MHGRLQTRYCCLVWLIEQRLVVRQCSLHEMTWKGSSHCIPEQAVVLAATLLLAAFLVLLQLPAAVSPLWLPWLGAAWGLLFPAALLLQAR